MRLPVLVDCERWECLVGVGITFVFLGSIWCVVHTHSFCRWIGVLRWYLEGRCSTGYYVLFGRIEF